MGDTKQVPYRYSKNIRQHCKNVVAWATWNPRFVHLCSTIREQLRTATNIFIPVDVMVSLSGYCLRYKHPNTPACYIQFTFAIGFDINVTTNLEGTAVAQWLRCCATNRKVAISIPDGVIGIFHWHNSSRSLNSPGVDSVSNRNEYQENFLGVNAAGA